MASSLNALLAEMLAARSGKPEVVPKGWLTRKALHKALGKSASHCDKIIGTSVKAKVLEKRNFRVQTPYGVRPVPFYRKAK